KRSICPSTVTEPAPVSASACAVAQSSGAGAQPSSVIPSQSLSVPSQTSVAPGCTFGSLSSQPLPPRLPSMPGMVTLAALAPSPSSSRRVLTQAAALESQLSAVQGSPSLQSRGAPPTQPLAASHVPPVVQKSASHAASFGVCAQPLGSSVAAGSQVSD